MVMMAGPAHGLTDHSKASLSNKLTLFNSGQILGSSTRKNSLLDGPTTPISQSHVQGMCSDDEDLKFPLLVKVLVGTKCGIVKWSEISGPACCALWVEIKEGSEELLAPSSTSGLTGELKLAYRLRARHVLVKPLLGGIPARQVLMQKSIQQKLEDCITGLASDCPRMSCQSFGDQRENSFYCLRGKDCCSQAVEETPLIWQISSDAFQKLVGMLAPAGILRNFQEVVMQLVDVSYFFDVPPQQLDLMELTTLHPYVISMDGCDLVVAWQGLEGLSWALINFDFWGCVVLAAKGNSLDDLRKYFKPFVADWSAGGLSVENQQHAGFKMFARNLNVLRWREWQQTSDCADCAEASALGSFLCDLFHKEGKLSAAEIAAAYSLNNLHTLSSGAKTIFHVTPINSEGAAVWELSTSCLRPTALATREHHALLQLRSTDLLVRQNNLQILLDLLPGLVSQKDWGWSTATSTDSGDPAGRQTRSNPATFRSMTRVQSWLPPTEQVHRSPAWSVIDSGRQSSLLPLEEKTNISNLLFRGVMAAIRRRRKVFPEPPDEAVMRWGKVGSQTERASRPGKLNWHRFYELKSSRPVDGDGLSSSFVHKGNGTWRILSTWIYHGFLEAILAQLRDFDHFSGWVHEAADACLRVVSCVPGDGSTRLVHSLLAIVQEKIDSLDIGQPRMGQAVVTGLVPGPGKLPQAVFHHHKKGETQRDRQQESWLCGVQNILQLLSSVTSESSVIAACLVQSSGLNRIVKMYNHLIDLGHLHRLRSKKRAKENRHPSEIGDQHTRPLRCDPNPYTMAATYGRKSESVDTRVSHLAPPDLDDITPAKLCESLKKLTESYGGQARKQPHMSPRQVRPGRVHKEGKHSGKMSDMTSLHEDSIPEAISLCKSATEGGRGDHRKLAEKLRPDIPRLSFSFLTRMDEISYASHLSSASFMNDSRESSYLIADSMSEGEFNTASRVSCTFHNLLCEAKCHVLSTLSSMLSVSSRTVIPALDATVFLEIDALAESLLAELLGGLSHSPACIGVGSQVLVYETIFRLDRLCDTVASEKAHGIKDENCGTGRRFSFVFLELISKRLDYAINSEKESAMIQGPSNGISIPKDIGADDCGSQAIEHDNPSLRFWTDVGLLFGILATFIIQWSERGAAVTVFRVCGRQVAIVLDMLASSGCPASWSIAQVSAMERLLRLVLNAFHDSVCCNSLSLQTCTEAEEFIWQLAAGSPQRWSCIERFSAWVLLDACHSCTWNLVQTYHRHLHEPVACHLCKNGQASILQMEDNMASSLQGWKKSVLKFLRVVVALLQRRVSARRDIKQGPVRFPLPETMVWLLDFLMNPVNGVLIRMLMGQQSPLSNVDVAKGFPWKLPTTDRANVSNIEQRLADSIQDIFQTEGNSLQSERDRMRGGPCYTNMDSASFTKHLQGGSPGTSCRALSLTCKACRTVACSNKSLQQDVLCLLADIFGLKLSARSNNSFNVPVNEGITERNPFLVNKYVDPFLDTLFRCFLQLYNTGTHADYQTDHTLTPQIVTFKVHEASSFVPSGGSNRQSNDMQTCVKTESMGLAGNISRSSRKNEVPPTPASYKDEAVSHLCKLYVGVLLTVAQNQSEDVRKRFRQLHVMEFLIQQISLEYEACHFVTPRRSSGADNLRTSDLSDSDAVQPESQVHENVASFPEHLLQEDSEQPGSSERAAHFGHEEQNGALKHSLPSLSMVVPQTNSYLERSSEPSVLNAGISPGDVKKRQVLPVKVPQLKLDLIPRDKGNATDMVDLFQSGTYLHQVEEHKQYVHVPAEMASPHGSQRGHTERHSDPESCSSERNRARDPVCEGLSLDFAYSVTCRSLGKSKYSGRFCDFNEEVDQELADEAVTKSSYGGDDADRPEQEKDSDSSVGSLNGVHTELEVPSHGLQIRPTVPKLNLPKSVRKDWTTRAELAVIAKETVAPASSSLEDEHSYIGSNSGFGAYGCAQTSALSYESARMRRRIYWNTDLHVLLLELVISLMLTPYGTLDAYYSDRFPMEKSKLNAPFFLSHHLNHPANSHVLPALTKRTREYRTSAYQILKLTCTALSNLALYARQERIARGAFAHIYTALVYQQLGGGSREEVVVLKTIDLPKGPHDPCKFFDVYSEVQILSKFVGQQKVCQVLDYGVDCDSYVLVLKHYKCSLRAWREQHSKLPVSSSSFKAGLHKTRLAGVKFHDRLPLYLEIYAAVLNAVKVLELQNVVHYDLKCDNILLEPSHSSLSAEDFWNPVWPPPPDLQQILPFIVCIADFGQSKASINQGGECTFRNRGTEYVRSPEMLKLLSSNSQVDVQFELQDTVGKAVDVWGLGCLLYELLTGEYLLYDEDWIQFFIRVTMSSEELITKEKAAKVENCIPIMHFLQFALVRDPSKRPSLDDLITRVKLLQIDFPIPFVELHQNASICQSPISVQNLQPLHTEEPSTQKPAVIVAHATTKSRPKTLWSICILNFLLCRCHSCSETS